MNTNEIIDIPKNRCNITTVEAEFDRAMSYEAELQRADPAGHGVRQLEHHWKHNRFNSCYNYGNALKFYMTQPEWKEMEPLMAAKGLPDMVKWSEVYFNFTWKLRLDVVKTRPKLAPKLFWWNEYLALMQTGVLDNL
jgi:hypothetical protein